MQVLTRSAASKSAILNSQKQAAQEALAVAVGETRARFITSIPGQELTYIEKERQALAFLAATAEPDPADPADAAAFAFVFQEVGITGQTALKVAQLIAFKAEQWRGLGPLIERERLAASAAIDAAQDQGQIEAALDGYSRAVADL
ncbi:hypothetical protein [Thalassovita sp.]|uniref:hypothetical protein n=1 Tax=Thalassovita sp. TaxID=1979401 RepID=UPI002AAFC335|nr:hypothetical protein [Thalassovita sp.]